MIASEADLAAALEALVALDPALAPLRDLAAPLPLRRIEPGFAGLAWVVVGQQISTVAGRAIYDRLAAELAPLGPETMAAADDAALRRAGLSINKMRTLRAAAAACLDGRLALERLDRLAAEEAIAALTALPGIGAWTAESYLLFALGHRDVFPAADIALQEAARLGFGLPARPKPRELLALAERWRPLRAVAARLLWAYYRVRRGDRAAIPAQDLV